MSDVCEVDGALLDPDGTCFVCRTQGRLSAPPHEPGQPLADVHRVFLRWLGKDYDLGALDAVLATAAAEQLGGDPCWLLIVSGSGAAKTETIMPLLGFGATVVSTISGPGALLSGTSEKDRAKDATGGLLRAVGRRGILVIKDFTSILSMDRHARAEVLAALREIYDGRWHRDVGSDGGRTLKWSGRLVVIGAVTTAWDSAHAVVSTMGDRFVLVRIESKENRRAAGLQALLNVDSETQMREQLAAAVGKLLGEVDLVNPPRLTEGEMFALLDLADIVTFARTAVERDYSGDVIQAHAPEMPTRFTKQLGQIFRGAVAIGMPRPAALDLAARCAGDSMPPMRLRVLVDVAAHPLSSTADVVERLQFPRKTVDRVLQELHLLSLLKVDKVPYGVDRVRWIYTLAESVNRDALARLALARLARNVGGSV